MTLFASKFLEIQPDGVFDHLSVRETDKRMTLKEYRCRLHRVSPFTLCKPNYGLVQIRFSFNLIMSSQTLERMLPHIL